MNSSKHLSIVLGYLTRYFEDIVIGVDSKSDLATKIEASKFNCTVITFENNGSFFCGSLLEKFKPYCKHSWVLRLDDDEIISMGLVHYLKNNLTKIVKQVVAFERKWARLSREGFLQYSLYPKMKHDWQVRLYRVDQVSYTPGLHTSGILYNSLEYVTQNAFVVHLDWILKSYDQRLAKVEKYEKIDKGFRDYYLYEELPNAESYFTSLENREFDDVVYKIKMLQDFTFHKTEVVHTNFYRDFENQFRGPRELIKSRLAFYLPFIEPFKKVSIELAAIDLGCGRGEWLELLTENGFSPQGVDINEGLLDISKKLGLSVEKQDMMECLQSLPDHSQVIVSAFHVVEHIPFETLKTLVKEAFRVLKPGGLLILETPNPENLMVSSVNFYLDPTHKRPLPPQLLLFLMEYNGFIRSKIVRLQSEIDVNKELTLLDVFGKVSPDYGVIAQKKGTPEDLSEFDDPFKQDYGVDLVGLAQKYQLGIEAISHRIDEIQKTFINSKSWRMTAPFRAMMATLRQVISSFKSSIQSN